MNKSKPFSGSFDLMQWLSIDCGIRNVSILNRTIRILFRQVAGKLESISLLCDLVFENKEGADCIDSMI
jgi:hypothetical protein